MERIRTIWHDPVWSKIIATGILAIFAWAFIDRDDVKNAKIAITPMILRFLAPDIVIYSDELQEKAAKEIESGKCPALAELAKGYLVMRDQSRVLRGEPIPPR